MYTIKQIPEDFIVKEIRELPKERGPYTYYLLKKKQYSTPKALEKVAQLLDIPQKVINAAGNKDKQAVTEQHISVKNGPHKDFEIPDLALKFLGTGKERINLGSLTGNQFIITVRNLADEDITFFKKQSTDLSTIPNIFDDQRFGVKKNNHVIGKKILKRDFKEACEFIPETKEHLLNHQNDYVGALKSLPRTILRLYVHAYQSYVWNQAIEEYGGKAPHEIPLPGFDSAHDPVIEKIMDQENMSTRDFVLREIPELSSEGDLRNTFITVKDFSQTIEEDNLHPGKKKAILKFHLPKGSYATAVISFLFQPTPS